MKKLYTTLTLVVIMLLCFKESFSPIFKSKAAKQKTSVQKQQPSESMKTMTPEQQAQHIAMEANIKAHTPLKQVAAEHTALTTAANKVLIKAEAAKAPKSTLRKTVDKVISFFKPKSKTANISLTDRAKNVETATLESSQIKTRLNTATKKANDAQFAAEKLGEKTLSNFIAGKEGTHTVADLVKLNNIQLNADGALVYGKGTLNKNSNRIESTQLTDNNVITIMSGRTKISPTAKQVLKEGDLANIKTYLEAVQKAHSAVTN